MNLNLNVESATFGHIAQADAPAVADALSSVIESVPHDAAGRDRYLARISSTEHAARLLCRAHERMAAAGEMAQPFIGKRYSIDFAEAASAADLLIASDLLMAMLLDRKLASGAKMKSMLATAFPDLFEGAITEFELQATGEGPEMLAILALRLHGVDSATLTSLAAWHGDLLSKSFEAPAANGVMADAGFLRDALFETYLGREVDFDRYNVSKRAIKIGMYAVAIAYTLAMRAANRRRRVQSN